MTEISPEGGTGKVAMERERGGGEGGERWIDKQTKGERRNVCLLRADDNVILNFFLNFDLR